MTRIIAFLIFSACASAQIPGSTQPTQPRASQIKEPNVPKASVRVVLPNGVVVYAVLDASLVLDMTTSPPTLRNAQSTTMRYFPKTVSLPPMGTGPDGYFPLPAGTVEGVYRNGLWLTEGRDYSIPAGKLLFTLPCCEADEALAVTLWVTAPTQ